jgi:hypothetical protein
MYPQGVVVDKSNNIIFQYTYPLWASTWVHPEYQQPKIQTCANIRIWAVTALKQLPFMVQNQTTPNKSLKIPTVANSFLCLPKFWYACHC